MTVEPTSPRGASRRRFVNGAPIRAGYV